MSLLAHIHGRLVHSRRVRVLAGRIAPLLPQGARVLDIGCGDGALAEQLQKLRPDLAFSGVDVRARTAARIPVQTFDGRTLPCPAASFDAALLADVLHHTDDPRALLHEARRVARVIVLKDHTLTGCCAGPTLRLMDWAGNAPHDVALPYNYWPEAEWRVAFKVLELRVTNWETELHLYPPPLDWVCGRRLHFLARLEREAGA